MSYETSPSAKMLATHCAVCGRALVDAKSVELSIGPDCREKYGFDSPIPEESRQEANELVYQIALNPESPDAYRHTTRIRELGLSVLADKILERLGPIEIKSGQGEFLVTVPFRQNALSAWRGVGRWDGYLKIYRVPRSQAGELGRILKTHYGFDWEDAPPPPPPPSIVKIEDGKILLRLAYEDTKSREAVKSLPARSWNPDKKLWVVPIKYGNNLVSVLRAAGSPDIVKAVEVLGFSAGEIKSRPLKEFNPQEVGEIIESIRSRLRLAPGQRLMPFQEVGVAFIEWTNGRALLADDMGLGKTVQAVAWLSVRPDAFPTLVLCPPSVCPNWEREILGDGYSKPGWLPRAKVYLVRGTKDSVPKGYDIYVCGYNLPALGTSTDKRLVIPGPILARLDQLKFRTIILDEVQNIKEQTAKRTKAAIKLGRAAEFIVALSGTPIRNRPVEFFPGLNLLRPDMFPTFFPFAKRYCNAHHNGYGWDFKGASNLGELHRRLKPVMIRREKTEVLTELPPKRREFVWISLEDLEEYQKAERETRNNLREIMESPKEDAYANILRELVKLRKELGQRKAPAALEWVLQFVESRQKLVVFAHHKEACLDIIQGGLDGEGIKYIRIDGDVAPEKRLPLIDQWTNDPSIPILLGTIGAGGIGLNLQAAADVLMVEREWTPADEEQAEDRAWRYGQGKPVTIWYLLADNSVMEEKLQRLVEKKREVIAEVIDGGEKRKQRMGQSVIRELAESLVKEE